MTRVKCLPYELGTSQHTHSLVYHIYPKYLDTLITLPHLFKIGTCQLDKRCFARFSQTHLRLKISFSWEILDKFDKFGTLFLIPLLNKSRLLPVNMCKIAGWVANRVDPDQMLHSAASDLGLHCLLRPICPNTKSKYGNMIKSNHLWNPPGSTPDKILTYWQKV